MNVVALAMTSVFLFFTIWENRTVTWRGAGWVAYAFLLHIMAVIFFVDT